MKVAELIKRLQELEDEAEELEVVISIEKGMALRSAQVEGLYYDWTHRALLSKRVIRIIGKAI